MASSLNILEQRLGNTLANIFNRRFRVEIYAEPYPISRDPFNSNVLQVRFELRGQEVDTRQIVSNGLLEDFEHIVSLIAAQVADHIRQVLGDDENPLQQHYAGRIDFFGQNDEWVTVDYTDPWRASRQQPEEIEEARERSEEHLRTFLNEEQLEDYDETGSFNVIGESGTVYRINQKSQKNIDVLDDEGNVTKRLCTVPDEHIPMADHMVSQLLLITENEERFLEIAVPWSVGSINRIRENADGSFSVIYRGGITRYFNYVEAQAALLAANRLYPV